LLHILKVIEKNYIIIEIKVSFEFSKRLNIFQQSTFFCFKNWLGNCITFKQGGFKLNFFFFIIIRSVSSSSSSSQKKSKIEAECHKNYSFLAFKKDVEIEFFRAKFYYFRILHPSKHTKGREREAAKQYS
jgi:hypothetical protein